MWTEALLENWHLLEISDELEIRAILIDFNNALSAAGLTDLEATAIRAVYMDDQTPPERTGKSHRPRGGSTRHSVAVSIGISRATLWKVLNSAILKIDGTLNYEGKKNEQISTTTVRDMRPTDTL